MSLSIKDLIETSEQKPKIESNIAFPSLDQIKKFCGEPHGMSLLAISMIDPLNKDLEVKLSFDSDAQLGSAVEHLLAVWEVYTPITSFIRSFQIDGKFVENFNNVELTTETTYPVNVSDYRGKKVIIDASKTGTSYKFKLYRWNEVFPRILEFSLDV
jgi:hypothetical protein